MELRKANFSDWRLLLDWRNDSSTLLNSISSHKIDEEEHKQWLKSFLLNSQRCLYIAFVNDEPVGTTRWDLNIENNIYELSWTIAPNKRGCGIGKDMVKALVEKLDGKLLARIKKNNLSSIRIAQYCNLALSDSKDDVLIYTNFNNDLKNNYYE